MDNEPIEPTETFHLTFDELLKLSMQEFRKSLGLHPTIVDADPPKPDQFPDAGKMLDAGKFAGSGKVSDQVTDPGKPITGASDDNTEKEQ